MSAAAAQPLGGSQAPQGLCESAPRGSRTAPEGVCWASEAVQELAEPKPAVEKVCRFVEVCGTDLLELVML